MSESRLKSEQEYSQKWLFKEGAIGKQILLLSRNITKYYKILQDTTVFRLIEF